MNKLTCGLVFAVLGVGFAAGRANAAGQIGVYFDRQLTQRSADPQGVGVLDTLFIVGENFSVQYIKGAQYRVNYGPYIQFIADQNLPPVAIGNSELGISLAFPDAQIKPGKKGVFHRVLVAWNADSCDASIRNTNLPVVLPHPDFPDPTPIVVRFPDLVELPAFGARAQICQFVELDVRPGSCPNPFSTVLWDSAGTSDRKGGALAVAILGSATVDADSIDPASCRLEGVEPILGAYSIDDVASGEGTTDCTCNNLGGDGWPDLRLMFGALDVAAALTQANAGDTLTLVLTGTYLDGMPFSATDCVVVVDGGSPLQQTSVTLGLPSPNPFNPTTRIAYSIPARQHVHLAVHDVAGRLVAMLVDDVKDAGEYDVEWRASGVPSGVYFYRLHTGGETVVRRATLLK